MHSLNNLFPDFRICTSECELSWVSKTNTTNIQYVHKQIAKFTKNVFIAFLDELGNFKQFFAKLAISQIDNHTGQ